MSESCARGAISRTEIAQRVKGALADVFSCGCQSASDQALIKNVGLPAFALGRRSSVFVAVAVARIERAFGVRIEEAHSTAFRETATVGDLVSLVEGALSQEGIA